MRSIAWTGPVLLLALAACGGGEKKAAGDSATATTVAVAADTAAGAAAAATSPGAEKYTQVCGACHQANGEGLEGNFPPLAGSEWLNGKAEVPIAIVLHGMQGEIEVKGKKYNGAMAPWGGAMTDAEIAAVLTHERSSWGNSAPAVTEEEVKTVRAKYASRTAAWSPAELAPLR
ncbi:MAG: cytochrome c [Gemmatimonadaceae bacterium]|nr:cytochrome c [Gemmatimonadaceae bacterium]